MQDEIQSPTPRLSRAKQFWLGIGLGAIPLVLALIAVGALVNSKIAGGILIISLVAYGGLLIAAIACLTIKDVRYVGYGLLAMFCVTPIVAAIACTVLFSVMSSHS
jgi:hypothetical protein